MPWYFSPHTGGKKVSPVVQERTRARLEVHGHRQYPGRYDRLDVRFRGALCYVDAYRQSSPHPLHLVRLRFFGDEDRWTLAFFTYSQERYEPCVFHHGEFHGTPEDALDVGAVYLSD
jgi:hypothetical protein